MSLRERSDRQGERVRVVRLSRRQPCPRRCDGFAEGQARPSSVRFAGWSSPNGRRKERGEIDPSFLTAHKIKLEDGPDACKMFKQKNDGCIKVVINP